MALENISNNLSTLDPATARKMFVSTSMESENADEAFTKNLRNLSMIYEALQNSLTGIGNKNTLHYPTIQELNRYLAIYKRSISDRSPMLTDTEILQNALILCAQRNPFMHILRRGKSTKNGLVFETSLVAPTEKNLNKVSNAYKTIVEECGSALRKINEKDFENTILRELQNSLESRQPEVRIGRVDHILRGCYLNEKNIGVIPSDSKKHIQIVNQIIFDNIYKPVIMNGIRSQILVSFPCNDLRKDSGIHEKCFYDIVHFADAEYIKRRLIVLSKFLNHSVFTHYWDSNAETILKHSLDVDEITQDEYQKKISEGVLSAIKKSQEKIPPYLIHLVTEIIKLIEWKQNYNIKIEKDRKQSSLNALVSILKKSNDLYQTRNKKWFSENSEMILLILRNKIPGIMGCTDPYINPFQMDANFNYSKNDLTMFFLLNNRNAIGNAIKNAIKAYEKNGNNFLLHVLENILRIRTEEREEVKKYVPPVYLDQLEEALEKSYLPHLPWWARVYSFLLYNGKLTSAQKKKIKDSIEEVSKKTIEINYNKKDVPKPKSFETKTEFRKEMKRLQEGQSPEEKVLIKKCCLFLDDQWDKQIYPTKDDVLNLAGAQVKLMRKILGFVQVRATSGRQIVSIFVNGLGEIYASENYLMKNNDKLTTFFEKKKKEEETVVLEGKTYLSTDKKKVNLYDAILSHLRKIKSMI